MRGIVRGGSVGEVEVRYCEFEGQLIWRVVCTSWFLGVGGIHAFGCVERYATENC